MPTLESAEALTPYLNPEYWEGHSIQYGMITGELLAPSFGGPENRYCKRELQERIGLMEKAIPLNTYSAGQTFDAETCEPGTIVLLREEALSGHADDMSVDPASLIGLPKPTRPVNASVSLGENSSTRQTITNGAIEYRTLVKWGVVAVSKHENVLRTISTGLVQKIGAGTVFIDGIHLGVPVNPIHVGRTEHLKSKVTDIEKVTRVNMLHVVAHGKTQKQQGFLRGFVAKLSFDTR